MPLRVKCPSGHTLIVPDDRAGRTLRCPRCRADVVVPGPALAAASVGRAPVSTEDEPDVAPPAESAAQPPLAEAAPPAPVQAEAVPSATAEPALEVKLEAKAEALIEPAAGPFQFLATHEPPPPPPASAPPVREQLPASAQLHADAARTLAAYQLAAALVAAAALSIVPGVWDVVEYVQAAELDAPPVARWALVVFFLAIVQLAYAVYLFQLPDWSSVWVVTVFQLVQAAGYAGVLGIVLTSDAGGLLVGRQGLQLDDKLAGGQAALWCLCMVSLATILAFFAGRMSLAWQRAQRVLRLAGY